MLEIELLKYMKKEARMAHILKSKIAISTKKSKSLLTLHIVYKGTPKSVTDVIVKARGSITKNCFTVLAQLCSARPSQISSG